MKELYTEERGRKMEPEDGRKKVKVEEIKDQATAWTAYLWEALLPIK
jgi:hypothetical protein